MSVDTIVLEAAIKALTDQLEELIVSCTGSNGELKAPDIKIYMKSRGSLPFGRAMALTKKKSN